MKNEQLQLVAAWISQYVTPTDGGLMIPADPRFLKDGIQLLIEGGVMTPEEIRREALKDYGVIIPWELMKE